MNSVFLLGLGIHHTIPSNNNLIVRHRMISLNTEDELSLYNLEGKWNDYIAIQKEVLRVLREKNFFEKTKS